MITVSSKSQDLFSSAAASGDVEKMQSLLSSRKNISVNFFNDKGDSPLILAAKNGRTDAVNFLLNNGAEANLRKNESDFVAIHHAAYRGHLGVVSALVNFDSSTLNVTCRNNHNALHISSENGRKASEIVRYLIAAGADVNAKTIHGNSPLILSLMNNNPEEAKLISNILLEGDLIDVNLCNNKGETALHWASQKNITETVSALILRDADIDAIDNSGKSPRDYASKAEIITVLNFANLPNTQLSTTSATKLKSVSLSH